MSDLRDLPERVVVDQHGHYWRDYGDYWSMCPVSEENISTEPVAVYVRAAALAEREAEVERWRKALEIIAAPWVDPAPDAIGVSARNVARAALTRHPEIRAALAETPKAEP